MSRKKRYSLNPSISLSPVLPTFQAEDKEGSFDRRNFSSGKYQDLVGNVSPNLGISSSRYSRLVSGSSSFFRISSSEIGHNSVEALTGEATANVKIILIGDAGVGKTAIILAFYSELPTRGQLKLMREVSSSNDNKSYSARRIQDKQGKILRNKPSVHSLKKRYSLNDYEELFNKRSASGNRSVSDSSTKSDQNDENTSGDDDELVIDTSSTIGIDIKTTTVNIDNRFFKCITWDTAGQERYKNAMIPSLYKGSHGILLTYDICDIESFRSCCDHWLQEAVDNLPSEDLKKAKFYLIGNKIDIYKKRQVTHEHVLDAISEIEFKFEIVIAGNFEVTCKWPNVVERTMNLIIKDLVESSCYEDKELDKKEFQNDDSASDSTKVATNAATDKPKANVETVTETTKEKQAEKKNSIILAQGTEYNDMVSESDSDDETKLHHRNTKNTTAESTGDNELDNDRVEEVDKLFPSKSKTVDITKPLDQNQSAGRSYFSCCA